MRTRQAHNWSWGIAVALGTALALVSCQSDRSAPAGGTGTADREPIAHGDSGPGGCTAGSIARPLPTSGETACFYGGGCPDGQVPVRIDTAAGSTVQCGWLAATACDAGWLVGNGLVDGSALCLPTPPCTLPANLSDRSGGAWTLALDCTAG